MTAKIYSRESLNSPTLKDRLISDRPWEGANAATMVRFLRMLNLRDKVVADFADASPRSVGHWGRAEAVPTLKNTHRLSLLSATAGTMLVATAIKPPDFLPFFIGHRIDAETFESTTLLDQFKTHEDPKLVVLESLEHFGHISDPINYELPE